MRRSAGYNTMNRRHDDSGPTKRQMWQQQSEELLEQSTDRQLDELEAAIGGLKHIGHEIREEIGKSNSILDDLRHGVDNAGGLLSAAQKKLREVSESGSNRLMCYMVLFVIIMFFLIYWAVTRTSQAVPVPV